MKRKSKNFYVVLFVFSVFSVSFLGISYAQNGTGNRIQTIKINKSQSLTEAWRGKITIRVMDMQSTDAVNIRLSSEGKINGRVFSTSEREITLSGGNKLRLPRSGDAISETALNLSQSEISFVRPQVEGKYLLDIELPESTEIKLFYNGQEVVGSSALYSPIAVRDGIVEKGEENAGKALSKIMFPQIRNSSPTDAVDFGENKLYVPFTKLQVKQSEELPADRTVIKAMIEINEQGFVEKVNVLEPLNSSEIEQNMREWKFVPYKKDGVAVKVSTFFVRE